MSSACLRRPEMPRPSVDACILRLTIRSEDGTNREHGPIRFHGGRRENRSAAGNAIFLRRAVWISRAARLRLTAATRGLSGGAGAGLRRKGRRQAELLE